MPVQAVASPWWCWDSWSCCRPSIAASVFFAPIVSGNPQDDNLTSLIRDRYDLPFPAEQLYGCTAEMASELVAAGQYEELLKLILNKYMLLDEKCDIVLCAGTDYDGLVPSLEFDFNADLANNFGCTIVVVVKGFGRSPEETLHAVQMAHESMLDRRGDLLAMVVNGLPAEYVDLVRRRARAVLPASETLYVLPETEYLASPRSARSARCSVPIVCAVTAMPSTRW